MVVGERGGVGFSLMYVLYVVAAVAYFYCFVLCGVVCLVWFGARGVFVRVNIRCARLILGFGDVGSAR